MLTCYEKYLSMKIVDYEFVEVETSNMLEIYSFLRKTINSKGFVVICYSCFDILLINEKENGMSVKCVSFPINKRCYYYKILDYIMVNCERSDMLNKCFGSYLKDYYVPKMIYV